LGLILSRKLLTEKAIIPKQASTPGLTASLTKPMMEVSACAGELLAKTRFISGAHSF
jgi:hypothetical protein